MYLSKTQLPFNVIIGSDGNFMTICQCQAVYYMLYVISFKFYKKKSTSTSLHIKKKTVVQIRLFSLFLKYFSC